MLYWEKINVSFMKCLYKYERSKGWYSECVFMETSWWPVYYLITTQFRIIINVLRGAFYFCMLIVTHPSTKWHIFLHPLCHKLHTSSDDIQIIKQQIRCLKWDFFFVYFIIENYFHHQKSESTNYLTFIWQKELWYTKVNVISLYNTYYPSAYLIISFKI